MMQIVMLVKKFICYVFKFIYYILKMIKFIKKCFILMLNIIFWLFIFFFLYIISFVNIENIYQINLLDVYTIWYFSYLLFWIISLILYNKLIRIKNNIIKEELLYTLKSIFLLSIFLIPSFFIVHNFMYEHISESNLYLRAYWKVAFLYFWLALSISPILNFIKNSNLKDNLILSRKILWILAFIYFLKHRLEYFSTEYIYQSLYNQNITYLKYVYKNMLDRYDALSWFVAWVLMLVLWITSNKISVKLFWWKIWKNIQSLAYPTFLLSIIHIAFSSRLDNFYIFLILFVVWIRSISYLSNTSEKKYQKTTKYICIPCWFIYDENFWDPDWWIRPWTKFEDIPNDRICPVCWASKKDFEPYYENEDTISLGYIWKVVNYKMLTPNVLELWIKINENINVLKWQYAILTLNDFDWEFNRAYSVVSYKDNILTFRIKLKDTWRWSRKLMNTKIWDTIKIKWIYWDFVIKDTNNQKVFIATGTWLSPIINMISEKLKSKNNYLFFGVQKYEDLFYLDKIQNIDNITTKIYLSRENIDWYESWRIDLTKFKFDKNCEFYICGNPNMVESTINYLKSNWYTNIYSEKFK